MWKYMYIDESGDLGEAGSQHIVITAFIIDNPTFLDRIIKNMRRHKFRKDLRVFHELKANHLKIEIIRHALRSLNTIPSCSVTHMVFEKKQLRSKFLQQDKHKLYNFIAGKLARSILLQGVDVEVRIDKSKGKLLLQHDFNSYFERCLREKSSIYSVKIFHSNSESWSGLQFADILSWAAFQKVEHGNPEFVSLLTIDQEEFRVW
jgi:hypothetical protein